MVPRIQLKQPYPITSSLGEGMNNAVQWPCLTWWVMAVLTIRGENMISIFYWIAVAFFVFGVCSVVATVGKPRKPIEGGAAVIILIINAGVIALLVHAALVL